MTRRIEAFDYAFTQRVFSEHAGDAHYHDNYRYVGVKHTRGHSWYVFQHIMTHAIVTCEIAKVAA